MSDNALYYGDNLDILRHNIKDESVDLIYLDPPFNSKADYNILYKEPTGEASDAQITAFGDTWHWTDETQRTFEEIIDIASPEVIEMIQAFKKFVGANDMMAYLTMMCIRLLELKRVLKDTGSIYLHCDPTASHYLKILMDTIFGKRNFRNEIIWRRTNSHNKLSKQYGPIHDSILFYSSSDIFEFHPGTRPYTKAYIEDRFKHYDKRGRYQTNYLTGPGTRSGESGSEWRGFNPTKVGRHWAIPASLVGYIPKKLKDAKTIEKLECLLEKDLIVFPKKEGGQPMYKQYIGPGVPYQDLWAYQPNTRGVLHDCNECIDEDVKYLESEDEKLGFDTQKPIGLLRRIILTSSEEGGVVLDPFCGCGTTVTAAHLLNRKWIGIDITHLAINLIKSRMAGMFKLLPKKDYKIYGEPEDLAGAIELASQNRYQFQWWAISLIENAKPYQDKKKGADTGIDGLVYYTEGKDETRKAIIQVKSGKVSVKDIRDLGHVIDREGADIGVFVTLEDATAPMLKEAALKGSVTWKLTGKRLPRIQILTIEELFAGKQPLIPLTIATHKKAVSAYRSEDGEFEF